MTGYNLDYTVVPGHRRRSILSRGIIISRTPSVRDIFFRHLKPVMLQCKGLNNFR